MPTQALCPYCRMLVADDKDHIFADFFGGSSCVLVCMDCNNQFGHEFEGRTIKQLTPFIVMLVNSGMPFPKEIKWEKALTHPRTGLNYDLGKNLTGTLSKVNPMYDESGNLVGLQSPSLQTAQKMKKQLLESRRKPKEVVFKQSSEKIKLPPLSFELSLNKDFGLFILKMCVAFCRRMNVDQIILEKSVLLALYDPNYDHEVRNDHRHLPTLDFIVPPLAHVIYVEACPLRGRAHAIVRLFGILQFTTTLHRNYCGTRFAGIGFLNPVDYSETFTIIDPLGISESSKYVLSFLVNYRMRNMFRRLDKQIYKAFGNNKFIFAPTEEKLILVQICISIGNTFLDAYSPGIWISDEWGFYPIFNTIYLN